MRGWLLDSLKVLQGTFKCVPVVMCGTFNFMYILWKGLLVLDITNLITPSILHAAQGEIPVPVALLFFQ